MSLIVNFIVYLREIRISKDFVGEINEGLPESPEEKLKKVVKKYRIGKKDAVVLTKNVDVVDFFEGVLGKGKLEPTDVAQLLRNKSAHRSTRAPEHQKNPRLIAPTAPAKGLTLLRVRY